MIRRHVLAAIAKGVAAAADGDDVARAALGRIDWVLRGHARRRFEQALIEAALAIGVIDCDAETTRHLLRAAALVVRRRGDIALADRDRVARAYEETAGVAMPRVPIASFGVAAIVLAVSTAVAAASMGADTLPEPPGSYTRPTPPPPVAAYRDGGVPATDAAVETLLLQIELSPSGSREPAALARWPGVATAWAAMVGCIERSGIAARDLRAYVQALSDQFAAAGLAYFVDLEATPPSVTPYRVEKVTFARAGAERVAVFDVRRLGRPAAGRALLGFKPDGLAVPMVLIDSIEEHVRTQLLPVRDGARYELGDDWWVHTTRGRSAVAAAGRAVRRELAAALGEVSPDDAAVRVRKLVLASVRHHEAQHGREQQHIPAYPEVLARRFGPIQDERGRDNPTAVRARNELSAYTSQIASDMWLPQATLWSLSRHAFQSERRGSVESHAAVIIIEGLARQLGIASPGPAFHGGELDRDRLAALVGPIAERSTIELRSAAARLWAELFDEPLVRLVDDVFGE